MYRNRKSFNNYQKQRADMPGDECALCKVDTFEIIEETMYLVVARNHYPYDVWDASDVVEHLMIMPRAHVASLAELDKEALIEIIELSAKYEQLGYDIYARSVDSIQRSVAHHQHTHLIKTGSGIKGLLFNSRPYWLLKL